MKSPDDCADCRQMVTDGRCAECRVEIGVERILTLKTENAKLRAALRLTLPLFGDGQFPVTADIVERTLRECSCDEGDKT